MSYSSMFLELLRKRRSIRRFQDRPVEKGKIDLLVEAALRSPSSRDFNPWEFVVVTAKETLAKLAAAKPHGAAFLKNAPLAVAVCADTNKSDVWIEDCAIAALILHLAATDLGLGSCWIQLRLRPHNDTQNAECYAADLLGLKEGMTVLALMAIGYPAEEKPSHPFDALPCDKIHYGSFGRKK